MATGTGPVPVSRSAAQPSGAASAPLIRMRDHRAGISPGRCVARATASAAPSPAAPASAPMAAAARPRCAVSATPASPPITLAVPICCAFATPGKPIASRNKAARMRVNRGTMSMRRNTHDGGYPAAGARRRRRGCVRRRLLRGPAGAAGGDQPGGRREQASEDRDLVRCGLSLVLHRQAQARARAGPVRARRRGPDRVAEFPAEPRHPARHGRAHHGLPGPPVRPAVGGHDGPGRRTGRRRGPGLRLRRRAHREHAGRTPAAAPGRRPRHRRCGQGTAAACALHRGRRPVRR